jgi:hypothetical protein
MAAKSCRFAIVDSSGVEHALTFQADWLYEAVVRGIAAVRYGEWIGDLSLDSGTVRVTVLSETAVDHKVKLENFQRWLRKEGAKSPRAMIQKSKVKEILGELK